MSRHGVNMPSDAMTDERSSACDCELKDLNKKNNSDGKKISVYRDPTPRSVPKSIAGGMEMFDVTCLIWAKRSDDDDDSDATQTAIK